jgi:hypothetical protein
MFENSELLPKDEVLKGQLPLSTKRRSQRSNDDRQPLKHGSKAIRTLQEKAIESIKINIQEGQ